MPPPQQQSVSHVAQMMAPPPQQSVSQAAQIMAPPPPPPPTTYAGQYLSQSEGYVFEFVIKKSICLNYVFKVQYGRDI